MKSIKGMAYITGNVSPNQAKDLALNDAKLNALKAAGIGENIKSYQLLFSGQEKNDFSQFFSSDTQSEMRGAIKSYDVRNQKTVQKSDLELYVEVTIDATVIKYKSEEDTDFDVFIEGLKAVYPNNARLQFTAKASKQCYLTIFSITDTEASLLYPNRYEKQKKLDALKLYNFPTMRLDYFLQTDLKDKEINRLIFVFTKKPVSFIKMDKNQVTSNENIFSWIYSIMPDQRKVEYRSFIIQK